MNLTVLLITRKNSEGWNAWDMAYMWEASIIAVHICGWEFSSICT